MSQEAPACHATLGGMSPRRTRPLKDFGKILGQLWKFGRTISYSLIVLMLVFLAFRVAELYQWFSGMHALAGYAFLFVFAVLFVWLVGRPVYRFMKMPVVVRPPDLPAKAERTNTHVVKHMAFVERYLRHLLKNPEWTGSPEDVEQAIQHARALRAEAAAAKGETLDDVSARIHTFEREHVERLLRPLDERANEVIRQEALGVGIATAVSWNGTIDAFVVLWRNCNLVSRVAKIYYGRPGPRGTLSILRDVSAATLASAYLQDLTEMAGGALGNVFGKTVGVLAGPLLDGGINAVATLRIGHLAKARCRAFQKWNERTRLEALGVALREAALFSKDVVSEVVRTVGGGLLQLPGKVLGKVSGALSGLWRKISDDAGDTATA